MSDPTGKIQFLQKHEPAAKDGDYEIQVTQTLTSSGKISSDNTFTSEKKYFSICGDRYTLDPQHIGAVFPPEGSLGEHSNVIPHISFKRSTLPWERDINDTSTYSDVPWMALLLFHPDEEPDTDTLKLSALSDTGSYTAKFPSFTIGKTEHGNDNVCVIDVPRSLLETMMPTPDDLRFMAHVRQGKDENDQPEGDELAVVIGNRLAGAGTTSTAHLVSLENRYDSTGAFDYQGAAAGDKIRLVSLKTWSFTCLEEKQNFKGLLENLNKTETDDPERPLNTGNTLRLPANANTHAENYLSMGSIPAPHYMRRGSQTVSWYRGPLITGPNPDTKATAGINLPAICADELQIYDSAISMFDASYAAAWELGRLLMLSNKNVSVNLFNWKRHHHQTQKAAAIAEQIKHGHLPKYDNHNNTPEDEIPEAVVNWFEKLNRLEPVPFRYLLPDERMLAYETLHFFHVDPLWMECMLDGAFSIGRVSDADKNRDATHKASATNHPAIPEYGTVSGFLLRSAVVSGYPHLQVDGYNQVITTNDFVPVNEKLNILRFERLSKNVLLCLFEGDVQTVDIHQKAEALHFGLDKTADTPPQYEKELKNTAGKDAGIKIDKTNMPWRDSVKKVLHIKTLSDRIKSALPTTPTVFTSAQFALEMIEGVEKVRFLKK
jgi:hypothetical protein